jgi:hypothetical protein
MLIVQVCLKSALITHQNVSHRSAVVITKPLITVLDSYYSLSLLLQSYGHQCNCGSLDYQNLTLKVPTPFAVKDKHGRD